MKSDYNDDAFVTRISRKQVMAKVISFSDIVDMTDALSLSEKEALVEVLRQRTVQERRSQLAKESHIAWKEYKEGKCKPVRAIDIMAEIMR